MEIIWITLIILANIFIYIRKIILVCHGYKVAWLVVWGDGGNLMNLIETNKSRAKRKLLFAINIAPCLFFMIGIIVAIVDWVK